MKKQGVKMQNKKSKFNWKLPLYGAIGFAIAGAIWWIELITIGFVDLISAGIGGAIGGVAFGLALRDKVKIFHPLGASAIGFAIGIWVTELIIGGDAGFLLGFIIGGAISGALLGLVLKDKRKSLYLSCAGAIGFFIGLLAMNALEFVCGSDIEYVIVGSISCAIGGVVLGLTLAYLQ
jgi:hypothetical protein